MSVISKNEYIGKLDDIADEHSNKYHITIKLKTITVNSGTYVDFRANNDNRNVKFEVGDYLGISTYKSIFANGYASNFS